MSKLFEEMKLISEQYAERIKNFCYDCHKNKGTVFYGDGAKRCEPCAAIFNKKNRDERLRKENEKHKCCDCNETYTGTYACPHCCEHEPDADEGYHCLVCGTDCSEDVI